jgi:hypothetical protein
MIKPLLPETEGKVARFEIVFYCRLISFCSFVSLCEDNSLWALWALRFIGFSRYALTLETKLLRY